MSDHPITLTPALRELIDANKRKDSGAASRALDKLIEEERAIVRRNRRMFGLFHWRYWLDRWYRRQIVNARADYDEACEHAAAARGGAGE